MAVGVPWGSQICKRHSSPSDETDRLISDAASGSWGLFHLLSRWREVPLGASAKLAIFGNPKGELILWYIYIIYIYTYEFIWGVVSRIFSGFAYNNPLKKFEKLAAATFLQFRKGGISQGFLDCSLGTPTIQPGFRELEQHFGWFTPTAFL